jgi:hypothetical protein
MRNEYDLLLVPELRLADIIVSRIDRVKETDETELQRIIGWNKAERDLYDSHHALAFKILIDEKLITKNQGVGISRTKYALTNAGRTVKDSGGYIVALQKKGEKESFSNKISNAEGKKKIFDNKVKIITFLLICAVPLLTVIGFWKKYSSASDIIKPQTQALPTSDTVSGRVPLKPSSIPLKEKHVTRTPVRLTPQQVLSEPEQKADKIVVSPAPVVTQPLQTTISDNIEFKLTKVEGNSKAQSIKITMVLTTSAANWYIMSHVESIIDPEGNEYRLKSYTIGASDYFEKVDLKTGVPIKCTYTFGGVLPDVKRIKLFNYSYTHSWGEPFAVEFRDVLVDWK